MRNTMIIFLVSGFWHGANWTFILWGAYHALLFFPLMLLGKNRKYTDCVASGRYLPSLKEAGQMALTFFLAMMGWVIFRSRDIHQCVDYFLHMFTSFSNEAPLVYSRKAVMMIPIMILVEWLNRDKQHGLQFEYRGWLSYRMVRWTVYVGIIFLLVFYSGTQSDFIYFQF
jgi:D-alanyl-lipoteichoic acid acyltransferase DltB (MBOAT superfamily)